MRRTYISSEHRDGHLDPPAAQGGAPAKERAAEPEGERAVGAGSATELAGGVAVAALAIIGLVGVLATPLLAIACIVAGGALVLASAAEGTTIKALTGRTRRELGGGVGADVFFGAAAVVLGILALIGFAPGVLTSVAAIALGVALLSSSMIPAHEGALGAPERAERAGEGAAAVQALVGVGAVALGILALVGLARPTLTLVAFLGIGAGMMLTGSALLAGFALGRAHAHA